MYTPPFSPFCLDCPQANSGLEQRTFMFIGFGDVNMFAVSHTADCMVSAVQSDAQCDYLLGVAVTLARLFGLFFFC